MVYFQERYSSVLLLIIPTFFFYVKDAERERRGEALWGEYQGSGRLRLFLWVYSNTENMCHPQPAERTTLSLDVPTSIHPSVFLLTGSRVSASKCHKNPDRKQKKDIIKCCPTLYLFHCNTRGQEIILANTTNALESLDDHEIILYYSINVKIVKICFTRFLKELCLCLFIFLNIRIEV